MGDNNYPTYEQRELGPLEAARRELQREVDAGRMTKKEMRRQHKANKQYWKGWGTPEWGKDKARIAAEERARTFKFSNDKGE